MMRWSTARRKMCTTLPVISAASIAIPPGDKCLLGTARNSIPTTTGRFKNNRTCGSLKRLSRLKVSFVPISAMPVYELDPLVDPRWAVFLAQHPRASVFHSAEWLRALQLTYRFRPIVYTTASAGHELQDGLAVCAVDSWLTGKRLISVPFSDH